MFVFTFSLLFALANLYVYHSVSSGAPQVSDWLIIPLLALAFSSLFLGHFLARSSRPNLAAPFAWIGYTWLGVCWIFVPIAAICDLIQLIDRSLLSDSTALFCSAFATVALTGLGWFSAYGITVRNHQIASHKFGREGGLGRTRLVQISDLHLGETSRLSRLKRIVRQINALDPDIIVSSGDLFDGSLPRLQRHVQELKSLDPSIGKFAILGNHECYADVDACIELGNQAGFKFLRNEALLLPRPLALVGIDDPTLEGRQATDQAEDQALREAGDDLFVVLLKHRPTVASASRDRFDLQLSGHTHGGQIFPFSFLTRLAYSAPLGLSQITSRSRLYHSRGAGSWGPPLRILSPPEIAVFDFVPKESLKERLPKTEQEGAAAFQPPT